MYESLFFSPRVLLFVDEADAFLRKRSKVKTILYDFKCMYMLLVAFVAVRDTEQQIDAPVIIAGVY